jgi:amidase
VVLVQDLLQLANLCVVAVGTETDGSVVCPSAVSGIVGIKPTIGLVSRGIIPISHPRYGWTNGKDKDAAILLGILELILKIQLLMKVKEKRKQTILNFRCKALQGKRIGGEKTSGPKSVHA